LINYSNIALLMLCTQCTLRSIYFFGMPFGTFDADSLGILFNDLPQLLFHCVVVLTGVLWTDVATAAQLDGQKSDKRILALSAFYIITLSFFYVVLAILRGIFLGEDQQVDYNCGTPESEITQLSASEICSLIYQVIFAFYSILIAITFIFQGTRIATVLFTLSASNKTLDNEFKATGVIFYCNNSASRVWFISPSSRCDLLYRWNNGNFNEISDYHRC